MTAAKVMDIISRLPGCAGEAADAVSAYTQVKMGDAPKSLKIPNIGMSRHLDSSTTTHMAKIMVQYGRPSRSSWAKSIRSSFGRTIMGKAIWENPTAVRFGKGFQLGMLVRTPSKRIILVCVCGCHKIGWKETKSWSDVEINYSTKKSIWENQHLLLIMYTWAALKKQWEIGKDIVDNYRAIFESRISAGGTEKLPFPQHLRISSWSYDMEGHAKKCVERYCELANKSTQQLYKVSPPCIDDHHLREEEMKSVGELSQVCSQIVLKCLYLARIGRPDILWSVNELARSIKKMDQSLWQTPESIDIIQSPHMWIQTILSCG